jgi:hypothetical protein
MITIDRGFFSILFILAFATLKSCDIAGFITLIFTIYRFFETIRTMKNKDEKNDNKEINIENKNIYYDIKLMNEEDMLKRENNKLIQL